MCENLRYGRTPTAGHVMDGYRIEPARLRALRAEAKLHPREVAERVGCHERHYRKFESVARPVVTTRRKTPPVAAAEPSAGLVDALCTVYSECLVRAVTVDDFARAVPSRWRTAA